MNINYVDEKDYFETSDMPLVATLYYFGYKIYSVDKSNPSRAVFLIVGNSELNKIVQNFLTRSLKVEPSAYFNSLKEVKSRLYEDLRYF